MVAICGYLERENDKLFKFQMNNSSFFESSTANIYTLNQFK